MAQLRFCDCSEQGTYGLGIVPLSGGQLACKNCGGVVPPEDITNELIKKPGPKVKKTIDYDYKNVGKSKKQESSPATLEDLVNAQDRTTHAVRSLAITFVAAPVIAIAVALGIVLAMSTQNTALMVLAAIFGLVVGIGTLYLSLEELRKSRIH